MKRIFFPLLVLLLSGFLCPTTAQRKQCIDGDWRFCLGDGRAVLTDPAAARSWRSLALPHDWSVEPEAAARLGGEVIGPFARTSVGGHQTGYTVGGEGWYQRTLTLSREDLEGRVVLYFEGAYNQSWLYVNGQPAGVNVYGYSSFRRDITPLVREGENSVVVKVVNEGNNTRWYAGSGIYRHVWLLRTARLYADEWDTYVSTRDNRQVQVATTIVNEAAKTQRVSVEVCLLDPDGQQVATGRQRVSRLHHGEKRAVSMDLNIEGGRLWSPATPAMYHAVIRVKDVRGRVIDELQQRFGLRTLEFSAEKGFLLNGEPTLLRGGCLHHDNGLLGAAAFDKAERRKLRLLKQQGFNAVRTSHGLPSENFLNACDELGLMVIDECFDQWLVEKNKEGYHRFFREHWREDLAVMVRRDRNHPSIIMWSVGNEIPGRIEPEGLQVAAQLREQVRCLDSLRPVTSAICGWDQGDAWNTAGEQWEKKWEKQCALAFQSLDVGGYNYLYGLYERDHAVAPQRVMCGLESYPKQASENWNAVERLPYVIGDFVWTAVDYLGEAGIGAAFEDHNPPMFQKWPWFNGYCGDLDLIGQKKPQSYYRDVVWRQAPVTMAVQPTTSHNNAWGWQLEEQSWTWPGREGQQVSVNVYSRAPQVRLYLNNVRVGDQAPGSTFWTCFRLPYEPGTLRAVNLNSTGQEVPGEEFELQTTGPVAAVRCIYEDPWLSGESGDLAFVTLELIDAAGRPVTSDCTTRLRITNEGAGELIACGSASPTDMQSFRSTEPRVFRGRALAIVRANGQPGEVRLKAEFLNP